jgi:hypothetical protein
MDELVGSTMHWDVRRRGLRRRSGIVATVVGTNGRAMLVRVPLRARLEVGSEVSVELLGGRGVVEIRHVAPTGDPEGDALVGIEFVSTDAVLVNHLSGLAPDEDGSRWWWQRKD